MKLKVGHLLMALVFTFCSFLGIGQNEQEVKQALKRAEFVLCPDGKAVGKAIAGKSEIREVGVNDFSDAYALLLRIGKAKEIKEEKKAGSIYYTYVLPGGKGQLVLTDKVKTGTKEVAVMEITIPELKVKMKEIRFVK